MARHKAKHTRAPNGHSKDAPPVATTPDHKQRKSPSLPSTPMTVTSKSTTPSTVTSKLTTESKRAVSMMSSLALNPPPKKVKRKQDAASKASLSDTVNLDDAAMIDWSCKKGLRAALEHYFDNHEDFEGLDYHDMVMLLCNKFKTNDIRPVLQGILQDAGKDWSTLKL